MKINPEELVFPIEYRCGKIYKAESYNGTQYFRAVVPKKVAGKKWVKKSTSIPELKTAIDKNFGVFHSKIEPLSTKETVLYREAAALLPPEFSIMDAVKSFLKHNVKDSPVFKDAIETYLAFLILKGTRRTDIIRYALNIYKPLFEMRICDISTEEIELCLKPHVDSPATFKSYRNRLNTFYLWAITQEYAVKNPVRKIVNPTERHKDVKFYTPEQALMILKVASENYPESVPYYALSLFAFIRPQTVERLDWSMVNFEKQEIYVAEKINKTNYSYVAHLPANLIEWLKPYQRKRGAIIGDTEKNFRNRSERFVRHNLPFDWIQDGCRHTGVSYSFELNGLETTLSRMGDKSANTLFSHYKGLRISHEAAQRFFALLPSDLATLEAPAPKFVPKTFSLKQLRIVSENSKSA